MTPKLSLAMWNSSVSMLTGDSEHTTSHTFLQYTKIHFVYPCLWAQHESLRTKVNVFNSKMIIYLDFYQCISSVNSLGRGVIIGSNQQMAAEEHLSPLANTDSLNTEVKRIDKIYPPGQQWYNTVSLTGICPNLSHFTHNPLCFGVYSFYIHWDALFSCVCVTWVQMTSLSPQTNSRCEHSLYHKVAKLFKRLFNLVRVKNDVLNHVFCLWIDKKVCI